MCKVIAMCIDTFFRLASHVMVERYRCIFELYKKTFKIISKNKCTCNIGVIMHIICSKSPLLKKTTGLGLLLVPAFGSEERGPRAVDPQAWWGPGKPSRQ